MNGREFVRRARRYANRRGQSIEFDPDRGKGSHGLLRMGGHSTIVKHSEIGPGLLASMLKYLEIDRKDF